MSNRLLVGSYGILIDPPHTTTFTLSATIGNERSDGGAEGRVASISRDKSRVFSREYAMESSFV
jgi:hypothetical protein